PAPLSLLKMPELLKVAVPLEAVRLASLRRLSVPPLLRAALPEMLKVEPRFSVPLMLRIRELMVGEAPAATVAVEEVEMVVTPGPSIDVPDQVTLLLAMIAPAPVNVPPLRVRASLKMAWRLM